jgi:hypothetical protein
MKNLTEVDVLVKQESAKAIGCDDGKGGLFWLPKSQIEGRWTISGTNLEGKMSTIIIPEWLAMDKGLV